MKTAHEIEYTRRLQGTMERLSAQERAAEVRAERAEALAARLVAALRGMAQMPEIDEKDGHRLRALARLELEQIGVEPVTTNEEA